MTAPATNIDTEPLPDPAPQSTPAAPPEPTGGAWWRLGLPAAGLALLAAVWSAPIVLVILGVLGIIAVHEAGHLIAARRSGVLATEYSICVGPVIYSRRAAGMTWTLRALPLGAFVRVVGMSAADRIPAEQEQATYRRASLPRRLAIVVAGPFANFALAVVLLSASMMTWGKVDPLNWQVAYVGADSPAAEAGIEAGDRIVAVDGVSTSTLDDVSAALETLGGERITLEVLNVGTGVSRDVDVDVATRVSVWGTVEEDLTLEHFDGTMSVAHLEPGGALQRAGLVAGDQVLTLAGTAVDSPEDVVQAVSTNSSGTVEMEVLRNELPTPITVEMGVAVATSEPRGVIGVGQSVPPQRLSPLSAVPQATSQLTEIGAAAVKGTVRALWPPNLVSFITGAFHTTELTEPAPAAASDPSADPNRFLSVVGAVGIGATLASEGVGALLWFLAMMSLFVGIFNLLPFPPLDGGHVMVALYETVRERLAGSKERHFANPKVVSRIAIVVFSIMMCLGVAAIWLDITSPLSL